MHGEMVLSCKNNFTTKKDNFVTKLITKNFDIGEKDIVMAVVGHGRKPLKRTKQYLIYGCHWNGMHVIYPTSMKKLKVLVLSAWEISL